MFTVMAGSNETDTLYNAYSELKFEIFVTGGNLACCLVLLVKNLLTLVILVGHKELRQSSSYPYRVCQTIADFLVGVVLLVRFFSLSPNTHLFISNDAQGCYLLIAALYIFKTESILCMVIISLERYVYNTSPIFYFRIMTKKIRILLIYGSWFVSSSSVVLPFSWLEHGHGDIKQCFDVYGELKIYFICLICIILGSSILIIVLDEMIYVTEPKKKMRVRFEMGSEALAPAPAFASVTESGRHRFFIKCLVVVYVFFFISWAEFIVTLLAFFTIGASQFAVEVAVNISCFNSTCSFYIMMATSPEFRTCLRRLRYCQPMNDRDSNNTASKRASEAHSTVSSILTRRTTSTKTNDEEYGHPEDRISPELAEILKMIFEK